MVPPINIEGQRFGRLTALQRIGARRTDALWKLLCDCGNEVEKTTAVLRRGKAKSCGCLLSDATRERSLRHGHRIGGRTTRTKLAYERARSLCYTPSAHGYRKVGGEGIGMCERWSDFPAFLEDMGERPEGTTLGRWDEEKDFSPENCIWIPSRRRTK
jgi:hypothetical protein